MTRQLSRRGILALGLGSTLLGACRSLSEPTRGAPSSTPSFPPPSAPEYSPEPSFACALTEANIEGPYYRAGAPFRQNLVDASTLGTALVIEGRVLSLDCRSPLSDAVLDVWHADSLGHYDNDGTLPPEIVRLRGKVRCAANGAFSVSTIVPGRYLNGRTYRPAHLHVKLSANGHRPLTTQLYFPGDPYNDVDPFIKRSLILDMANGPRGSVGHYDFVLQPV
jgi:catechol 1,2-dioxygenase